MLRLLFLLIMPIFLFAQSSNWDAVVDLNLTVTHTYDKTDLYSDRNGNHIIVENGSTLKYYLYSSSGSLIRSSTIEPSITSTFSKITGYDGTVYLSYIKGNTLYSKQSVDAGQTWTNLNNITLNSSTSDGMELWTDSNGLHVVYSSLENGVYESHYALSKPGLPYWVDSKTITDEPNVDGGRPSITSSSGRVHVGFTSELSEADTRDKSGTTWQTSQQVTGFYPERIQIIATSNKLHAIYSEVHEPGLWLQYKNRPTTGSIWSSVTTITGQTASVENGKPDMTVSYDNKLHMVYYEFGDLRYREWNGSLSSSYAVMSFEDGPRISANNNDIYVIGIVDNGNGGYEIHLRQRDFAPLEPTGISSAASAANHPLITWDENKEMDVREYKVYRRDANSYPDYVFLAATNATSYEDSSLQVWTYGPVAYKSTVSYKVSAVDYGLNESPQSSATDIEVVGGPVYNRALPTREVTWLQDFKLENAYPNPFNPATTISYALPEAADVRLEVYNMSGQKISVLHKGTRQAGYHSARFDGGALSSGIYIYRLTATGAESGKHFSAVKRMLLIK
ncbi:MAG: T9SS C-terminal target domain-containing protein [Calditrichaeota bacterium]|nr:MAG: T9SS C-terminal target domain-containing protein [Calditrichota bacterium]